MANFIRSKLNKRRSRTNMSTGGTGTIEDEEPEPVYNDFASSAHYSRKPVSVTLSSDASPPLSNSNKQSPQHSDSTASDGSENLTVEDYTQPVDAIMPGLALPASLPTVVPVPTPSDEDYTEPYEVNKAVQEFDSKQFPGHSDKSHSKPTSKKNHSVQNGSAGGKKSQSPKKANLKSSTPKHSPIVEEDSADNYDKLVSTILPFDTPQPSGTRYGKLYTFGSTNVTGPQTNEVTYQTPWDQGDAVREFEKKFQATSPTVSPHHNPPVNNNIGEGVTITDSINTKHPLGPGMDSTTTYCQPWDLGNTRQQIKNSIEKASTDKKIITQKSVDIPQMRHQVKKQMSHCGTKSDSNICDTTVYDAPWDNSEKQKELEERLKAVQMAPSKRSDSIDSTQTNKRADGTDLVYEEPWDVGSRGKAISDMLNNTENKSPTSRRSPSAKDNKTKHKSGSQLDGGKPWSAIGEPIDPSLPLDKQPWYHGTIGRVEAETMLRVSKEGSYLVRNSESTKESYSLSMKSAKGFIHIKIEIDDVHRFILGENSQPFEGIPGMIYHYSRNLLPIKGADHMILLHPVIKDEL